MEKKAPGNIGIQKDEAPSMKVAIDMNEVETSLTVPEISGVPALQKETQQISIDIENAISPIEDQGEILGTCIQELINIPTKTLDLLQKLTPLIQEIGNMAMEEGAKETIIYALNLTREEAGDTKPIEESLDQKVKRAEELLDQADRLAAQFTGSQSLTEENIGVETKLPPKKQVKNRWNQFKIRAMEKLKEINPELKAIDTKPQPQETTQEETPLATKEDTLNNTEITELLMRLQNMRSSIYAAKSLGTQYGEDRANDAIETAISGTKLIIQPFESEIKNYIKDLEAATAKPESTAPTEEESPIIEISTTPKLEKITPNHILKVNDNFFTGTGIIYPETISPTENEKILEITGWKPISKKKIVISTKENKEFRLEAFSDSKNNSTYTLIDAIRKAIQPIE